VQAEDFRVITLKLFETYGEKDTRPKLINLLHKFADEQIVLDMSHGFQILNLVHVKDVCKAYFTAYNNLTKDNEYNGHHIFAIGNEESYSLKQVIVLFEEITGKKIKVNWGGRPYRKREVMKLWINGKQLPNWTPDISLQEGLKKYK
jgi:CDP-paratose synthetase